jgi:hypothetical protein
VFDATKTCARIGPRCLTPLESTPDRTHSLLKEGTPLLALKLFKNLPLITDMDNLISIQYSI